jgi:hypothetical protein
MIGLGQLICLEIWVIWISIVFHNDKDLSQSPGLFIFMIGTWVLIGLYVGEPLGDADDVDRWMQMQKGY